MRDLLKSIKTYEETYNLNMEPNFQRSHVWTDEQQIAFLEYFSKGGKSVYGLVESDTEENLDY